MTCNERQSRLAAYPKAFKDDLYVGYIDVDCGHWIVHDVNQIVREVSNGGEQLAALKESSGGARVKHGITYKGQDVAAASW